ncbi:MAG: TolC family protein [Halarcobacter sp.]
MVLNKLLLGIIISVSILNAQKLENTLSKKEETLVLKNDVIELSLNSLVQEVVRKNSKGLVELINVKTKENELISEEKIFEPTYSVGITFSKQKTRTGPEDSYYSTLLTSGGVYESRTENYEAGFSGLMPTGGTWEFKFIRNNLESNVIRKQYSPLDTEYRDYLKLSIEQPLLKNAGYEITTIKHKLAQINKNISEDEYNKILTELVGVTIQSYWQFYGMKKTLESWDNLIKITKKNLKNIKDLASNGKVPETEVLDIENRLYLLQLQKIEEEDKLLEKRSQIFTLLNISASKNPNLKFKLTEDIYNQSEIPTLEDSLQQALKNWSEYNIAKKKLQLEIVTRKYLDNQILPDLKIKADITNQSLGTTQSKALQELDSSEYQSWNVGLEFSTPIFGNEKMKSYIENSKLNVLKGTLELNALEKNLDNSLHARIEKLKSTRKQMDLFKKGLRIKKELLDIENEKLLFGKTNVKKLLEEEEQYIDYERKMYERVIEWKTAEATLQKAMGTLLKTYNINIDLSNLENKVYIDSMSNVTDFKKGY